MSGWRNW